MRRRGEEHGWFVGRIKQARDESVDPDGLWDDFLAQR